MGSSFVNIDDRGFWARDWTLEVWLRLLALRLEQPTAAGSTIGATRDQFLLASEGAFNGAVPHGLDTAVATPAGLKELRRATRSLLVTLEAGPELIPAATLDLLGLQGTTVDVVTAELLAFGRVFFDLVDGRIVWTAADAPTITGRDV